MDCSTPGFPVPHHLLEFAQARVHCLSDAAQPSHPLTYLHKKNIVYTIARDILILKNCLPGIYAI